MAFLSKLKMTINNISRNTWGGGGGGVGFSDKCIFLGYEEFVDIFKMSSQIGLDLGGISMYFRLSSKG